MHAFHRVALEHEDGAVEDRVAVRVAGVQVVGAGHGGRVVGFDVQRETRVGQAGAFLAWSIGLGDSGPAAEVEVGTVLGLDGERAQVVERSGVSWVNGFNAFLDDVEKNDRLERGSVNVMHDSRSGTHVSGVHAGNVEPVGPVDQIGRLGAVLQEVVVGSLVNFLDLGTAEEQGLNGPVPVLNIVDRGGQRGDDTEVVAGTLHRPPEVGGRVNRVQGTVGKDNVHRNELVGNESVVTLEPTMSTTKTRSEKTDTFACSSHSLLASSPKRIGDISRDGSAANGGGLSTRVNRDAAQLAQVDLNARLHLAEGGD